jgi:hypothetical protein
VFPIPRPLVPFAVCVAAASAQIPFDHLVYVNRTPSANVAAMGIVDPASRTVTPIVPASGVLTQHGSRSAAIDPAAPATIYSITSLAISVSSTVPVLALSGNRFTRTNLPVALGAPGVPFHVRWAPGRGLLLLGRGGQVNRMFLRDMTTGVVTSQPTPTLLPDLAADMVCIGSKAYALSEGDGTATATATIVEWDLAAGVDRVVGSGYPPFFAMAGFNGLLLCGDAGGTLHLVDPVSGVASPFLPTALGRVGSIAVDSAGRVFVVAENGASWTVHDVLGGGPPLWTSTVAIDDLIVAPAAAATMLTFGTGCAGSGASAPVLGFTGPPALGSTFAVTLAGALAGAPAVLAFGSSRTADPFGPLPRDLAVLGMPGCTQYTDLGGTLAAIADGAGAAQLAFTLPSNPAFAGARVPVQWLCLDVAANAFGATTSSGGELFVQ